MRKTTPAAGGFGRPRAPAPVGAARGEGDDRLQAARDAVIEELRVELAEARKPALVRLLEAFRRR